MDGTVASDTALRCATAAHTFATMEALNSRKSVKPDHNASLLSRHHGMTICYGMLFSERFEREVGQVMQLEINERIEDATLRRQGAEAELTYLDVAGTER